MTDDNPENIRESNFDFTVRFGEINPDMPYLADEVCRGPKRLFLPFPLCSEGVDEKKR